MKGSGRGPGRGPGRLRERLGHTLIELAVVLILLAVVVTSVYGILLAQWRFHSAQVEVAGARDAARAALELLAAELRSASPSLGDLYAIAIDSVALRSTTGYGVICSVAGDRIRLRRVAGTFGGGRGDSVLVFREGRHEIPFDDVWSSFATREVRPGGQGVCPDGLAPDLTLAVNGRLLGVATGAPVRGFRPYVYRLYRGPGGGWWLGQRLRQGRLQPVAGPFVAPDEGGLRLHYFRRDGSPARASGDVARVVISVRARSLRPISRPTGRSFFIDSLATVVHLRNS